MYSWHIPYYQAGFIHRPVEFCPVEKDFGTGEACRFRVTLDREQAINHRMIEPFSEKQVASGVISYGLSSYGYDLRVSDEFKIFTNVNSAIIDPEGL